MTIGERGAVELVAVSKRYGDTLAVDNINLKIPAKSYCCLLGPSGCGKTTTLRMIAGHEEISEGDILLDNKNISNLVPAQRGTAMMFQSYALFPHLNCADNVAFSLRMQGVAKDERRERAMEQLKIVHMEHYAERLPAQLSGGQQQRVALARALITNPDALLLDEPLSALDPFLRVRMREELKRLQTESGITFIHVTHSQEEAMALADLVVVMDGGKLQQADSARQVFNTPRTPFVARFMGGHNVFSGPVSGTDGNHWRVQLPHTEVRVPSDGQPGERIVFSVRSDRLALLPEQPTDDQNVLACEIAAIEFQGLWVRVALTGATDEEINVTLTDSAYLAQPFQVGDRVYTTWQPQDAHLLSA